MSNQIGVWFHRSGPILIHLSEAQKLPNSHFFSRVFCYLQKNKNLLSSFSQNNPLQQVLLIIWERFWSPLNPWSS